MIKETIKIHDKFQFEVKMSYELNPEDHQTTYDVDTYFFIPNSLGISQEKYSRADFFNDMQIYIRFKTPVYLLEDLEKEEGEVFASLRKAMTSMVAERSERNRRDYENRLKMLCCIFKATLRDHVDYLYTRKNAQDERILFDKFIRGMREIPKLFRKLRGVVAVPGMEDKLFSIYLFADEYISLLIEQYAFKAIDILDHRNNGHADWIAALKGMVRAENAYRRDNGYPSLVLDDADNEIFLYRSSVLKKYMGSILFLSVQRQAEVKLIEHALYAIAAGISMIVATAVAFYCQLRLGNLTLPFFVALVVSYMFKDRIKAVFQQIFSRWIHEHFYDQKERIYYDPKRTIGVCKESVDFCDARRVPDEIRRIRNCDHMTEIENGWVGQTVIRYRRSIELYSPAIRETFQNFPVRTVNDILRFNVSKFLLKMDDPQRSLNYLKDDEVRSLVAERAYHVNLIMRFSTKSRKAFYKRFRIVLNREGISRLEEISVDLMNVV